MRATQRAIVGVGLTLAGIVAVALLVTGARWLGSDPSNQPATRATGPQGPLVEATPGPPEPIAASEDTSVGTLPPPADATVATQLMSRDLLPPAAPARPAEPPAGGRELRARTAPDGASAETSTPAAPGFTVTREGWTWGDRDGGDDWGGWDGWGDPDSWYDADGDCRDGDHDDGGDDDRRDRRDDCDSQDRRD